MKIADPLFVLLFFRVLVVGPDGFSDRLCLHLRLFESRSAICILMLYSPYGADASLNKLLLLLESVCMIL